MRKRAPRTGGRSMGNQAIYRPKKGGRRYQGLVTKAGAELVEKGRADCARLHGRPVKKISDGDLFEYLARTIYAG